MKNYTLTYNYPGVGICKSSVEISPEDCDNIEDALIAAIAQRDGYFPPDATIIDYDEAEVVRYMDPYLPQSEMNKILAQVMVKATLWTIMTYLVTRWLHKHFYPKHPKALWPFHRYYERMLKENNADYLIPNFWFGPLVRPRFGRK